MQSSYLICGHTELPSFQKEAHFEAQALELHQEKENLPQVQIPEQVWMSQNNLPLSPLHFLLCLTVSNAETLNQPLRERKGQDTALWSAGQHKHPKPFQVTLVGIGILHVQH